MQGCHVAMRAMRGMRGEGEKTALIEPYGEYQTAHVPVDGGGDEGYHCGGSCARTYDWNRTCF